MPVHREIVGDYEILDRLGGGGMGDVYLALHRRLGRRDALKILRPEFANDPAFRTRFLNEGQIQARVRHPHIVEVIDLIEDGLTCALVMQLVEGEPLTAWVERHPQGMPRSLIGALLLPVVGAMGVAHARRVVHRDLKPANILVEQRADGPFPLVVDFGIAWVHESSTLASADLTEGRLRMGTPAYMSPEQARGEAIDHRTDVFALGAILYELLTGRKAFQGSTQGEILEAVQRGSRAPLRRLRPDVPAGLAGLVDRCLEVDRDQRLARCSELADELRSSLEATFHGRVRPDPQARDGRPDRDAPVAPNGWRLQAQAREGALRRLDDLLARARAAPDEEVAADVLDSRQLCAALAVEQDAHGVNGTLAGWDPLSALATPLAGINAATRGVRPRASSAEEAYVGSWYGVPLRTTSPEPSLRVQLVAVEALGDAAEAAWARHWTTVASASGALLSLEQRIAARRRGRPAAGQGLPLAPKVLAAGRGLRRALRALPPWPSPQDLAAFAEALRGLAVELPDDRALALTVCADVAAGRAPDPAVLRALEHPPPTVAGNRALAVVALARGELARTTALLAPALAKAPEDADLRAMAFEVAAETGDPVALREHGALLGGGADPRVMVARGRVLRRRGDDDRAVLELSRLAATSADPVLLALRLDLDPLLRPLLPRVLGLPGTDLELARVARRVLPGGGWEPAPGWLGSLAVGEVVLHATPWRGGGGLWVTTCRVAWRAWFGSPVVLSLPEVGARGVVDGSVVGVGDDVIDLGDRALAEGLILVARSSAEGRGQRLSAPW